MEEIEGLDKVIVKLEMNTVNGLVIRIKNTNYGKDFFIEPRGSMFQPLNNKKNILRVTSLDLSKGTISIKIHRKHFKLN